MINHKSAYKSTLCAVSLSLLTLSAHGMIADEETSVSYQTQSQSAAIADVADQLIVTLKPNADGSPKYSSPSEIEQAASGAMGMQLKYVRTMATGSHVMSVMNNAGMQMSRISTAMSAAQSTGESPILDVQADGWMTIQATPNDPRYTEQWHYYEATGGLNVPNAWDTTTGGGSVVAVIDTGITSHPDLNANVLPGYDMISSATIGNDGNGRDSDPTDTGDATAANECGPGSRASSSSWHGTHVAGTVAAVGNNRTGVTGVAYNAKIVPIRALGRCGGRTSDIADAMIWAAGGQVRGAPRNPNPADVINLSLGGNGSCDRASQAAINQAVSLGATVVVAAGNSNVDARGATPANCQNVVTVAATGRRGGKASYSNFGNVVDIAAPGGDQRTGRSDGVLSTLNTGRAGPAQPTYAYYQGTSMAAPHVAGVAALMYSVNPDISPAEVETLLQSTSRSFPARCSGCGEGIVDATAAVAAANPGGSNPDPVEPDPVEPEPSVTRINIARGVQVNDLSAPTNGEIRTTINIPAGATDLRFLTGFGSGNADLYVRFGAEPTAETFDCRSARANNNRETCAIDTSRGGTYHVLILAQQAVADLSAVVRYEDPVAQEPDPVTDVLFTRNNIGWNRGTRSGTFTVPAGTTRIVVEMSGGRGNGNLGVRPNGNRRYTCTSTNRGTNNETCVVENPAAGTWQISVAASSPFSGANLVITGER